MIKAKCDKGDVSISIRGGLPELCADTLTIVQAVYETLKEEDMIAATLFRDVIEAGISKGFEIYREEDKEDE